MFRQSSQIRASFTWGVVALLWPLHLPMTSRPCNDPQQQVSIVQALDRIANSVDPCGESPEIAQLLQKVTSCQRATYQICTDVSAERNWFDRPEVSEPPSSRTINWNPALRDEIESSCDGDTGTSVRRDPIASLLHELAHAAQDCDGLNPGEHEFEAVRIENIYRRAAGLCQRSKYGDDRLPPEMLMSCTPGHCLCTSALRPQSVQLVVAPVGTATDPSAGDARSPQDQ